MQSTDDMEIEDQVHDVVIQFSKYSGSLADLYRKKTKWPPLDTEKKEYTCSTKHCEKWLPREGSYFPLKYLNLFLKPQN